MAADIVALARRSATSGSRSPATTAARWSPSAPGSTTPTRSPTWPASTCCRRWTCGTCCTASTAAVAFHLYLMAQPPGLPEQMIAASADAFFGHFLDAWGERPARSRPTSAPPTCAPAATAVPSIVADYRASAGIDVAHDQADRDAGHRLAMPVTVLQQDWGAALGYDAARALARLGAGPRPPHRDLGPLHGRGGARRGRGDPKPS